MEIKSKSNEVIINGKRVYSMKKKLFECGCRNCLLYKNTEKHTDNFWFCLAGFNFLLVVQHFED